MTNFPRWIAPLIMAFVACVLCLMAYHGFKLAIISYRTFKTRPKKDKSATGGQSRKGSFLEAVINTIFGYLITLAFAPLIYKICNVKVSLAQINTVVILFTILSVIRSYLTRRVFNKIIVKAVNKVTA